MLIHDRFHTLEDKVRIVQNWPGIGDYFTNSDFVRAVEDAQDTGLLGRFETASPKNPLLNVVVSVYLGSVIETFLYSCNRLRDAFAGHFVQSDLYMEPNFNKRLGLFRVTPPQRCIKVEVVDLGANWNPGQICNPKSVRNIRSAHVQVLCAGAQDPEWVRQMSPNRRVPCAFMGGYALKVPGFDWGMDNLPVLSSSGGHELGV